jgi:hypothetical protein
MLANEQDRCYDPMILSHSSLYVFSDEFNVMAGRIAEWRSCLYLIRFTMNRKRYVMREYEPLQLKTVFVRCCPKGTELANRRRTCDSCPSEYGNLV